MLRNSKRHQLPQSTNLTETLPKITYHAGPAYHKNTQNNCYRCRGKHPASDCRFYQLECWICKRIDHIEKICCSKLHQKRARGYTRQTCNLSVEDTAEGDKRDTSEDYSLYNIQNSHVPMMVTLRLNGWSHISMELDTGAEVSTGELTNIQPAVERKQASTTAAIVC